MLFTAVHEVGHAASGILLGGTVEHINLWRIFGMGFIHLSFPPPYDPVIPPIVAISGIGAEATVMLSLMLLVPWRRVPTWGCLLAAACFIHPIHKWYYFIRVPFVTGAQDDAARFVGYTGMSPVVAALVGVLAYAGLWVMVWRCVLKPVRLEHASSAAAACENSSS